MWKRKNEVRSENGRRDEGGEIKRQFLDFPSVSYALWDALEANKTKI